MFKKKDEKHSTQEASKFLPHKGEVCSKVPAPVRLTGEVLAQQAALVLACLTLSYLCCLVSGP